MSPIKTYGNWCEIDQLDDIALVDGELLNLRYPDGHTESTKICVIESCRPYQDHGHEYTMRVKRAFVEFTIHGATGRIYLGGDAGFLAERP